MFRTKSLSAKEMVVLASSKGHRKESKENRKSSLRSLIADKTLRYHQHLQKFVLSDFSLNSAHGHSNSHDVSSWKRSKRSKLEPFEIRQFQTSPSEEFQEVSDEQDENQYVSPLTKYFENENKNGFQKKEGFQERGSSPQQLLKQQLTILKQYCEYLKSENYTFRQEIESIRSHFGKLLKDKNNEIASLEQESKNAKDEITKFSQKLKQLEQENKQKHEKIKELQSENKQLKEFQQTMLENMRKRMKKKEQMKICSTLKEKIPGREVDIKCTQTSLTSNNINDMFMENERIIEFLTYSLQQKDDEKNIIFLIEKVIKEKMKQSNEPYQNEISLLKEVNEGIKKKYQQKIKTYFDLLMEARKQIQKLLRKLREAKEESVVTFRAQLDKERELVGIKGLEVEN